MAVPGRARRTTPATPGKGVSTVNPPSGLGVTVMNAEEAGLGTVGWLVGWVANRQTAKNREKADKRSQRPAPSSRTQTSTPHVRRICAEVSPVSSMAAGTREGSNGWGERRSPQSRPLTTEEGHKPLLHPWPSCGAEQGRQTQAMRGSPLSKDGTRARHTCTCEHQRKVRHCPTPMLVHIFTISESAAQFAT